MAARIVAIADAVVGLIQEAWSPSAPDEVTRDYVSEETLDSITGRKVFVYPAGYGQADTASRSEDLSEYRLGIQVIERHSSAGLPSRDWMDARVLFVEEKIYGLLGDIRDPTTWPLAGVYPEALDVQVVYDFEWLDQRHTFRSSALVIYREIA